MKYSTLTDVWCILLILLNGEVWSESTVDEIYSNEATIELILHSQDNIRSTKYIHGIYTSAGAVFKVEGNMEQVHPNTLCGMRPLLTFGNIYILKLERRTIHTQPKSFCSSAAEKASKAIDFGATAVVLVITDYPDAVPELAQVVDALERPVIIINQQSEEDKLLVILNQPNPAYMRISPVGNQPKTQQVIERPDPTNLKSEEKITYIGIAVIFGLIIVLVVVAIGVIIKLRSMRRRIQTQSRGRFLESMGTHKYREKLRRAMSSCSTLDSPCPICLENYKSGEEVRVLPCTHQYHKKCIDKWLMEHRTCPCCCGDIDELIRLGSASAHNPEFYSKSTIQSPYSSQYAPDSLVPLTHDPGLAGVHRHPGYRHNARTIMSASTDMKELLPPGDKHVYVHSQYQYLLQRLKEVKRQRPSTSTSVSDSEAQIKSLVSSSCYSSLLDIDSSIPCENQFIGDGCQGGFPNQCETISLCEEIETANNYTIRQYTSSKSTLPSVESANMSPRVSELDLVSNDGSKISSGKHSLKKTGCTHCHGQTSRKSSLKSRTVRFRDPESEVLSSAEDDMTSCECAPCHMCKSKYQTTTSAS